MNNAEVAFEGRVGSGPELRHVKNGEPALLSFSVAVDDGGDATTWVRVAVLGERAGALAGSLRKGSLACIAGRLTLDTYEGRDGQTRASLEVAAWKVEPLGQIGRRRPPRVPARHHTEVAATLQRPGVDPDLDDEMPF